MGRPKKTVNNNSYAPIKISFDYILYDYKETLTYEQVDSVIYIIELYHSRKDSFSTKDLKEIQKWLTKNDLSKFLKLRDLMEQSFRSLENFDDSSLYTENSSLKKYISH